MAENIEEPRNLVNTSNTERAYLALAQGVPIVIYTYLRKGSLPEMFHNFVKDIPCESCCDSSGYLYDMAQISPGTRLLFTSFCDVNEPQLNSGKSPEGMTGSKQEGYTLKNGLYIPNKIAGYKSVMDCNEDALRSWNQVIGNIRTPHELLRLIDSHPEEDTTNFRRTRSILEMI